MQKLKERLVPALTFVYSLMVSLFWTALRINYAGISKFLGADKNQSFLIMYLPVMVLVLLWLLTLYGLFAFIRYPKRRIHTIVSLALSVVFTIAIGVVIYFGSIDYLTYILPHFYKSVFISLCLLFVVTILFFPYVSEKKKDAAIKIALTVLIVLSSFAYHYGWRSNAITTGAVVYAVEDEYQIVFSSRDNSIAWVEVGGERYFDLYAGSMRSKDLVHKVSVPQSVLDEAKGYTIAVQQLIYRGPFGGYKGKVISEDYSFTPVDTTDGISYYVLSDVHESYKGAYEAASQQGTLDFLVVLGDITSMTETAKDANAVNVMNHRITKGEIPVLYARGNHEIKGETAEDLYKYVASKNQKFYYTFSLSGIKGIVLDLGEAHDDDWWEYFETAQFNVYRDEQTKLLEECLEEDFFKDSSYRMLLCHIPVPFVNSRKDHEEYKNQWTELLNQMDIDIALSGHQHDITVFEPGRITPHETLVYNTEYKGVEGKKYKGYLTDFNFYTFLVARRSNKQAGDTQFYGDKEYTGLKVDVDLVKGTQRAKFTNALGKDLETVNIFTNDPKKVEYVFPVK
ncbi:MAG: metallophosphoesterase [Spirochaetales bacterium]|nr:metallophosphoesterase [Candidatus Physcosoma equi]